MSKLNHLINEMCPNGVEKIKLKQIANVTIGEFVHKNKQNDNYAYPVFNGGTSNTGYYEEYNNDGKNILISARGANAGFVNKIQGKYWAGNSCYTIKIINSNKINWLYIYYYLKNNESTLFRQQQKGSIPAISKKQIEEVNIFLPPIVVQNEIVDILNNLTELTLELTTELTTELTARKEQYEYYREMLMSFDDTIPRRVLAEICELNAGGDISKDRLSKEKTEKYNIPVYSNGIGENSLYGYTDKAKVLAPCLTIAARGTIGYCTLRTNDFYPIVRLICAKPKLNHINISFLKYYIDTIKFKTPTSGIPQLTVPMISRYKIPIPSIEEQEKIVSILDRFNKISNDIFEEISAEIKARQKQYEYYRDKLLTFKELKKEE